MTPQPPRGLRDLLELPLSLAGGRALALGPPLTWDVRVRRGVAIRVGDGTILRTDHYAPAVPDAPTVLVRTPYGRGGLNALAARMIAGLGLHVVVSSCRGTSGSTGSFDPLRHERADGLDTVAWLRRQPWFNGRLGTFGPSYVGYTQWAIADVPELVAMATSVTSSTFREPLYAGASFALYTTLAWANLLAAQARPSLRTALELVRGQPALTRALAHLPLGETDALATGQAVPFFQQWLGLAGAGPVEQDAYWGERGHEQLVCTTTAPVLMMGGWHDIFLPWQLRDYATLRSAGGQPQLTIGSWTHGSGDLLLASLREGATWLRAHLRDEPQLLRANPVRVFIENAGWREYPDWPPAEAVQQSWHLHAGRRLSAGAPEPGAPDRFRYDPNDPTPSVAGPVLLATAARPRDNRALEARADVLVFTSAVLRRQLDVVGPVSATVYVRASRPYHDVFVRLCDVAPGGASVNVCDGLLRLADGQVAGGPRAGGSGAGRIVVGADGVTAVEVELWPAGHRFRAGHRLRVQVSAGAHPRYARNPGSGEGLLRAVRLHPVEIEVFHDPEHPSAVRLSVVA